MAKPVKTEKVAIVPKEVTPLRRNRFAIPSNMVAEVHFHVGDDTFRGGVKSISSRGLQVAMESAPFTISANQHIEKIQVFLNNKMVYQGRARVIEETEKAGQWTFYLYLMDSGYDQKALQTLLSSEQSLHEYLHFNQTSHRHPGIEERFKSLSADFLVLLAEMESRLNREFSKFEGLAQEDMKKNLEAQLLKSNLDASTEKLQYFFEEIYELANKLDVESGLNHQSYFRSLFSPIFLSTPFIKNHMKRSLGYSGDYSPTSMFYEDIHQGSTVFHRLLYTFLVNQPAALSHQGRVNYLSNLMLERYGRRGSLPHAFKLACLEGGACLEARQMLERVQKKDSGKLMEMILLEQEDKTLAHAQKAIRSILPDEEKLSLRTILGNAVDAVMVKSAPYLQNIQNSDMIVVPGLLDNLSDRLAGALIGTLYSSLRPGGTLVLGNSAKEQPDHFPIHYLMEGARFVRQKNDLLKLVGKEIKEGGGKVQVIEDPLGLYLFLVIDKK